MTSHSTAVPLTGWPGGRGSIVALGFGAVVAGAQSLVDQVEPTFALPSGLVPIALLSTDTPDSVTIGGPATRVDGPAANADDLASLAKGVELERRAAARSELVAAADADGGAPAALPRTRAGGAVQPVRGRVTSAAGPRDGTTHYGLDIANRIGTPILAVSDGVVERSGPASGFGLWVVLRHPDGSRSVYGHINRSFVRIGQRVTAGDRIAEVGNRGQSTGPHLHLEIWDRSGKKIDPAAWLRDRGVEISK